MSINWLPSNDVNGDFIAYEIFYSVNINGPYTLISIINNINTTNYLHVMAQANHTKSIITLKLNTDLLLIIPKIQILFQQFIYH